MAQRIDVTDYETFVNCVQSIDENILINCYFCGSKGEDDKSWCPYCIEAEPVIISALEKYGPKDSVFIVAQVGERESWRDRKNPFKTDRLANLQCIPTIIRWNQPQRLEGSNNCSKEDLLELFFTDELDEYCRVTKRLLPVTDSVDDRLQRIKVDGYVELMNTLSNIADGKQINIFLVGSRMENGLSWCPDCIKAEPFVETALKQFGQDGSVFIFVTVGDRSFFKDKNNPFRTDKDIFISVIPTLIRWKKPQRLAEEQCANPDLLEMFFTDIDEE